MVTEHSSTNSSCVCICESFRNCWLKSASFLHQIADRDAFAERVALAEGFQLLNDPPHVGLGFGGNGGHQPGDGLAVLGDGDLLALGDPLQELGAGAS